MNNQYIDECRAALNLGKYASLDEMKTAFKSFQKLNHPDKGGNPEKFVMVQELCGWLTRNTNFNPDSEQNFVDESPLVIIYAYLKGAFSEDELFDILDSHFKKGFSEDPLNTGLKLFGGVYMIAALIYASLAISNLIRHIGTKISTGIMKIIETSLVRAPIFIIQKAIEATKMAVVAISNVMSSIAPLVTNALYSLFGIEKNVEQTIVKNNESTITENVEPETTSVLDNQAQKTLEISTSTPTITLAYENSKNIENSSKPIPSDELTTREILHNNYVNNALRFSM